MAKEKWKRLKEDNRYLISSWGRIFSLTSEKVIRPYIHKSRSNNYLRVCLREKKYMVHVLVAMNFKAKEYALIKALHPDKIIQVDHNDRNTLNCNVNNVSFLTESENKIHMHETNIIKFNGKIYRGIFNEHFKKLAN